MNPLSIGGFPLEGRALLAPMSGVTDAGLRRIACRFGATLVVSEMIASHELTRGTRDAHVRAEGAGVSPHVVQLAGCEAGNMAEASRIAEGAGAGMIDINMGCPAKRVTGGWSGSALMRDIDHAVGLIEAVVASVSIPVSVKMRLGWDSASLNAAELARRAESVGVALVCVHGRTRQQFYKGKADWTAVRAIKNAVRIPVVANGDVVCLQSARLCLSESRADAVMIGRAALGQPWLVGQIAGALATGQPASEPSMEAKTAAMIEHYESLLSAYGIQIGIRHSRKHLAAYADRAIERGSVFARGIREHLVTAQTPSDVINWLARLYENVEREAA